MRTKVALYEVARPTRSNPRRKIWILRWRDSRGKCLGEVIGDVGKMTKRQANEARQKKQSEMDCNVIAIDRPERMTLAAFETFHAEIARGEISAGSMLNVQHAFRWAKRVFGGDIMLTALSASHVARLRNAMDDAKKAAPTVSKTLAYLRAAMNRAKKHKLLIDNPFDGFKVKNADKAKDAVIRTRDEMKRLKAEAPNEWWRALIGLWFTGLREEEALALKWSDVDFKAGAVVIRQCDAGSFKVGDVGYPILAWTAKTTRSYRTVPIAGDTLTALKKLREASDDSAYVFLSTERLQAIKAKQDAGQWRADSSLVNNILRDWQALQRRVLGSDASLATIHDCRKTFSTHMADEIPIQALADIVGDTPNVLMKYYTKTQQAHADKLRAALDDGPALRLAV